MWQETSRRLRGFLRKRGANSWMAEDLAQEVLARALANDITFIDADDLMRWCTPVAINLHIDHVRRGRWADHSGAIPESSEPVDVERTVMARIELDRVLHHLGTLKAAERQAIVDGVNRVSHAVGRQAAVSEAVRRHRARQRLARLVGGAAAIWGWLWQPRTRVTRPALLTALPVAALSSLIVSPWVQATSDPPPRLAVTSTMARELQPQDGVARPLTHLAGSSVAGSVPSVAQVDVATLRSSVVRAAAPTGNRLDIGTRDRPAAGVLICVADFPVVADTCVTSPVRSQRLSATVVISGEGTG